MNPFRTLYNRFSKRRQAALYDYRQVFLDFNRMLHVIKDKSSLVSSILTRLYELVPSDCIHLFWGNNDNSRYTRISSQPDADPAQEPYFLSEDGLIRWLRLNETPLVVSFAPEFVGIYSPRDRDLIEQHRCELVYPLKACNEFKGIVLFGKRKDGRPYDLQNLGMMSVLLDNAALALENILYNEERTARLKHMFQTDRLAIIGQLAAGAAHEIRNPLTSIRSTIQYVQNDIQNPQKRAIMHSLLSEIDRINDIVSGLLSFSRQNDPVKKRFDLAPLMEQTLLLIKKTRFRKQVDFRLVNRAEEAPILADPNQLKQVFMNILLNAVDAIEEEGTVTIVMDRRTERNLPLYSVEIADTGKGMEAEQMENLFTPFFTTKEEGTGLGLSISYGIVQRHGGNIEVQSEAGKGTRVLILLPVNG